jgi:cytochrome c peroxidase
MPKPRLACAPLQALQGQRTEASTRPSRNTPWPWRLAALASAALALSACGGGASVPSSNAPAPAPEAPTPAPPGPPQPAPGPTPSPPPTAAQVEMGRLLFHDPRYSSSGAVSCASCHTPQTAHADPAGGFLPLGGRQLQNQGLRSSPTLHYLNSNREFRIENGRPVGGFTWDGRAPTRAVQAGGPFFDEAEMANTDARQVVTALRAAPYFGQLLQVFGLGSATPDAALFETMKTALALYQQGDEDYQPFSSKYDAVLEGRAALSVQEARGLALFNNPSKGNCAACHSSAGDARSKPLFTNFGYAALGVPRNHSQATREDPNFFDLGLCGPKRSDLSQKMEFCGQFKTPTLRNVALTAPYFHNAAIGTLEDAVAFHVSRDTEPARWYPVINGVPVLYNDLPATLRRNVTRVAPFDRRLGEPSALSPAEIQDVVAFLKTLTDAPAPPPGP